MTDPDRLISRALEENAFPGITAQVEVKGKTVYRTVRGSAAVHPVRRELREGSLFDLASLTKPLATAPVMLALMEKEGIGPEEPVGRFLPELTPETAALRLKDLMCHTSGLPPVPEMFRRFPDGGSCRRETALGHLFSLRPEIPPRREVRYSCTGFILLGLAAEAVGGAPLNELFRTLITDPAGLDDLMFRPGPEDRRRAVTEEYDPWRGRWLRGEVHDENAWTLDGISGNAGLFGTLESVSRLGELFLQEGVLEGRQILSPGNIARMTRKATGGLHPPRAFGFAAWSEDGFAGPGFSPASYGHTGFTGTSLWIDPEREMKITILTNRVHYGREATAEKIRRFRLDFHGLFLRES